jgi:hypothetical protein
VTQTSKKQTWKTEYGLRRVKDAPPTLDEAIFAAQGLTDDPQQQAEVAASLMGVPVEEVTVRLQRAARIGVRPLTTVSAGRNATRTVVVERRVSRAPAVMLRRVGR